MGKQIGTGIGAAVTLTIGDLISTPELGLRLLTENTRVDRAITWVHVSER